MGTVDKCAVMKIGNLRCYRKGKQEYFMPEDEFNEKGDYYAIHFMEKEFLKSDKLFFGETISHWQAERICNRKDVLKNICRGLRLEEKDTYKTSEIFDSLNGYNLRIMFKYWEEVLIIFGIEAFKKNEELIAHDAQLSLAYSNFILKKRFELGEEEIKKNLDALRYYEEFVLCKFDNQIEDGRDVLNAK